MRKPVLTETGFTRRRLLQGTVSRYKGSGSTDLKKRVKTLEIVNLHQVRFHLHELWPDFLTFYATPATGAAWIVPKKYVEKVGDDGFKSHPVGLGPYRFVSHQPGIEVAFEAYPEYWRKPPAREAPGHERHS